MKVYTRRGDSGETGLLGDVRVRKDTARVEAYGTVDELNCQLGVVRAALPADADPAIDTLLARLQSELFDLGAELATPPDRLDTKLAAHVHAATDERTAALEGEIDRMEAELEPLKNFVLPGGTPAAAALHVARAVCRRAERRAITLAHEDTVRPEALRYLNRLSDLLFVMARYVNHRAGIANIPWRPS